MQVTDFGHDTFGDEAFFFLKSRGQIDALVLLDELPKFGISRVQMNEISATAQNIIHTGRFLHDDGDGDAVLIIGSSCSFSVVTAIIVFWNGIGCLLFC